MPERVSSQTVEIVKVVFNRTYDVVAAGHDNIGLSDYFYEEVYPSGLHVALSQQEDTGIYGSWDYDRDTNRKVWREVVIPETPRIVVCDTDGVFTEVWRLMDIWLESHNDTTGEEYEDFIVRGVEDFRARTNQL